MTDAAVDKVIAVVRKLYALAKSSNEHEAANAIAKAEKLIQEHRLSQAAIDAADSPITASLDADPIATTGTYWVRVLLGQLASGYSCAIVERIPRVRGGQYAQIAVGHPDDVRLLRLQFDRVRVQIVRLSSAKCKGRGRAYAYQYKRGVIAMVHQRILEAQIAARVNATGPTSTAIVRLDARGEAAQEAVAKAFPNIKVNGPTPAKASEAFFAGVRDGRTVNLGDELAARTEGA